jgi:hypothetical protein
MGLQTAPSHPAWQLHYSVNLFPAKAKETSLGLGLSSLILGQLHTSAFWLLGKSVYLQMCFMGAEEEKEGSTVQLSNLLVCHLKLPGVLWSPHWTHGTGKKVTAQHSH